MPSSGVPLSQRLGPDGLHELAANRNLPMSTTIQTSIFDLNDQFRDSTAEEVLRWAAGEFGRSVSLACSFGAEDLALLDILARVGISIPVFVLDTGRLHEETYDVMQRCRLRYDLEFEVYTPDTASL